MWKAFPEDRSMKIAFYLMINLMKEVKINARDYSRIREEYSKEMSGQSNPNFGNGDRIRGEKNPNFGKKHSEEALAKMSDSKKGEKHPNFGKKHSDEIKQKISASHRGKKHSEKSKRKMSDSHRGKKFSIEHKQKISASTKGKNNPNYGKLHSEETRKKMSDSKKGRNKGKITCLDIEERIFVNITTVLYQQNRDRYFTTGSKVYREYKLTASQEAQIENN